MFCVMFGRLLQDLSNYATFVQSSDPSNLVLDIKDVDWQNLKRELLVNSTEVKEGIQGVLGIIEIYQASNDARAELRAGVNGLCINLLFLGLIAFVAGCIQRVVIGLATRPAVTRIRKHYIQSLLSQDMTFHDAHQGGELVSHVTVDMERIERALGDAHSFLFMLLGMASSGIIVGFVFSPKLAAICALFVPMIGGSGAIMARFTSNAAGKSSVVYAAAAAAAEEALTLIRTVTAFGGQKHELEQYTEKVKNVETRGIKGAFILGLGSGVSLMILYCSCAFMMWFSFTLVERREAEVGDAMTVFFSIVVAAVALGQIFPAMDEIASARGCAYTVYNTIQRKSEIDALSDEGTVPEKCVGRIEFKDVDFRYNDIAPLVIRNLTLDFAPGKSMALVGFSGSGKSTTITLLERFYDVSAGTIDLDGSDIRSLNIQWLRNQIGYVGQEPVLFGGTIRDNIAAGAPLVANPDFISDMPYDVFTNPRFVRSEVSQEKIEEAAEMANAHNFITNLPDSYNTLISEGGGMLSGGQKQRIAIARALLRDPKILLLDEATSALDVESETIVQAAMDKASAGRTTIVIAHRLSTVRNADVISFMSEGEVIEKGSHDELVALGGAYAEFVAIQMGSDNPPVVAPSPRLSAAEVYDGKDDETLGADDLGFGELKLGEDTNPTTEDIIESIIQENTEQLAQINATHKDEVDDHIFTQTIALNKPELPAVLLGTFMALVSGVLWPIFAYCFGSMLFVLITLDFDKAMKWIIIFFSLGATALVSNTSMYWAFGYAKEKLTRRLRVQTFRSLMRQDIGFFDFEANRTSALTVYLSTDASAVSGMTGDSLLMQTTLSATVLCTIMIGLFACWPLALVMMMSFVFSGLVAMGGAWISERITRKASKSLIDGTTMVSEYLQSVRTVTYLGVSGDILQRYNTHLNTPEKGLFRASIVSGFSFGVAMLIILAVWGFSFWWGVELIAQLDQCNVEGMITTFSAVVFGGMGMASAFGLLPDVKAAKVGATRLYRLINREPLINSDSKEGVRFSKNLLGVEKADIPDSDTEEVASKSVNMSDRSHGSHVGLQEESTVSMGDSTASVVNISVPRIPLRGDVTFHNVEFRYPSRPGAVVLDGFTIGVAAGQTLALVGESGCGKSSAISLLERFYLPRKGSITMDDYDLKNVNISSLRRTVGFVGQEPDLFTGTVRDNLLYGLSPSEVRLVTEEAIRDALQQANALSFIDELEEGVDTHIGVRGMRLSGGQKQRVAIARVLLRDPQILLLDEATSALDAESERAVQQALDAVSASRTTIMIAHRLATVRKADVIAVVVEGVVAEMGTHDELITLRDGKYKKMVDMNKDRE
ncbi:hypothetical protein SARC_05570 [Sphaeroforma arctica JP610]|uniref:Uncharacterized protein n=1 Tax=Sphaeroforma arctica JP610 TaxID=667725 RepID=A0A0L0FZ82_9EUKA|nr:hypothetical protein SARC_05570 [Sphaeroforma arctica JP610]KNC82132.1 hypothetical protein SARC_05570 [Sphaeroforma arctica JP610]|eukprot:XP_014156034.1 hypothetical protein SARC_05570 [Sphaeroforma arctica JP610]